MDDLYPVVAFESGGHRQLVYGLQPKQKEAWDLTPLAREDGEFYPKHIGYGGAAGGGKSHLARAVAVAAAMRWPGCTGIIFRKTKPEVKTNHVIKFKMEVPQRFPDPRHGEKIWDYSGEDMCATFFNNSRIYFGYLNREDDLLRYQGAEYDFMIFEEATHYPWNLVRWLTGNRLRATVDAARPFVLYPSNPGNVGHHWYKRLFITRRYYDKYEEQAEDFSFVQAKLADNFILNDRDPTYIRELNSLPEPYRSWLRDGDWEAGMGLALTMCDPDVHLIKPFEVPKHWNIFGSFDWGFAHPFSFGLYAVNEDGRHVKLDTISHRGMRPPEILAQVRARCARFDLAFDRIRFAYAGHDCWHDYKARAENVPTIAEEFLNLGLVLVQANISRVSGLNNLRRYLSWEAVNEDGSDGVPLLTFFDTEGNRKCFEALESLPSDPDNPEDALKQDADEFGFGGDDMYDETRYAVASREVPSRSLISDRPFDAWSPEALQTEYEAQRKGKAPASTTREVLHPEFGGIL